MHKIFDRSDANSTCRACFSRWNTRPSVASVVVSRIKPHSLPPLFHSEFSLLENRVETLPSPPPLILKLQIERDIRVLFRRMSRWKRSRRDSRPQHPPPPRYYPRLSSDSTNPRQGLNPTQPQRFEEWRGSSQAGCLAHAAFPLPLHTLFIRVFLHPYQHSPRRFLRPTLRHYLAFLRFSASVATTTTPLLRFDPCLLHPSPHHPAPSSPFFVISPLLSRLSSPLYYHSPAAAAPAAVATLPLFLSLTSTSSGISVPAKFWREVFSRNTVK